MNQNLQAQFAAEVRRLCGVGTAGEAMEQYLLDENRERMKIPNAVYSLLEMLGEECDGAEAEYTEYSGRCRIKIHEWCREINDEREKFQWYFWRTEHSEALNPTDVPKHDVCIAGENRDDDSKENVVKLKLYAKLAYQCMVVYDAEYECYLPKSFFMMVKYTLLLCSYKAFFAALKSAVKRSDAEGNYLIREVLETVLELADGFSDDQQDKGSRGNEENGSGWLYQRLDRMTGERIAAVERVISTWETDGDLERKLKDIMRKFVRHMKSKDIRNWVSENKEGLDNILGDELNSKVQKYCRTNLDILN